MVVKKEENGIKLKVAEAIQDDVGKGIVRMDTSLMRKIDVAPGDVVEISAEKKTVAIADRAYPADLGLSIIRMDGLGRWNTKAGIGEQVIVKKAKYQRAKTVTIAPAQNNMRVQLHPETAKQALLGRAMLKGNIITLGGTRRRRKTFSGSPFEDIFKVMEEMQNGGSMGFGFGDIKFVVVNTNPKGPILITGDTNITVSPQAIELDEKKVPEVSYEDLGGIDELRFFP